MPFQDRMAFGLWLINPDGTGGGEVQLPGGRSGTDGPTAAVGVAIDAFDWRVGGSAAHGPGFRPRDWLDEALLVLVIASGVGLLIVRRWRKRRMGAAAAELA